MIEAKGLLEEMEHKKLKWQYIKLNVMSWYCSKLKQQLLEETELRKEVELKLLKVEMKLMQEMMDREKWFAHEVQVLGDDKLSSEALMHAVHDDLSSLRQEIQSGFASVMLPLATEIHRHVVQHVHEEIKKEEALALRESKGCQTDAQVQEEWMVFLKGLPSCPPVYPLSEQAVCETVVRLYHKAVDKVHQWVVSLAPDEVLQHVTRHTVFDLLMEHYNSQNSPGYYDHMLWKDQEGAIARLLRSCKAYASASSKLALFCQLTGMLPSMPPSTPGSWHFLISVLHCLRELLGSSWKATCKEWATPAGMKLPIQCVIDLLANVYNAQDSVSLGPDAHHITSLVIMGPSGPSVDLDDMMLALVATHARGAAPRWPAFHPRRITDGSLPNMMNAEGQVRTSVVRSTLESPLRTGHTSPLLYNTSHRTTFSSQSIPSPELFPSASQPVTPRTSTSTAGRVSNFFQNYSALMSSSSSPPPPSRALASRSFKTISMSKVAEEERDVQPGNGTLTHRSTASATTERPTTSYSSKG